MVFLWLHPCTSMLHTSNEKLFNLFLLWWLGNYLNTVLMQWCLSTPDLCAELTKTEHSNSRTYITLGAWGGRPACCHGNLTQLRQLSPSHPRHGWHYITGRKTFRAFQAFALWIWSEIVLSLYFPPIFQAFRVCVRAFHGKFSGHGPDNVRAFRGFRVFPWTFPGVSRVSTHIPGSKPGKHGKSTDGCNDM